jgi:Mrp family chromosome partitioning ATPase
MSRQVGLADILTGAVAPGVAIRPVLIDDANVSVLTAGSRSGAPAQLLNSGRGRALFRQLAMDFDVTVVDSPPLNMVADGALLASVSDGVLIVARAGATSADALALGMEQLRAVNAPVLGALLNDIDFDREASYDPAYRYYRPEMYQTVEN